MVMMIAKLMAIMILAGVACGIGGLAYLAAGRLTIVFPVATWVTAAVLAVGTVPLVAWTFARYDMSEQAPLI